MGDLDQVETGGNIVKVDSSKYSEDKDTKRDSEASSRSSSADRIVGRTALEEKLKIRGALTIAELKKSLDRYESADAKVNALVASQASLLEEKRLMQKTLKEQQHLYNAMAKKLARKEQEHQKALMARSKLETLCRELQKCNRTLKEENLDRLKQHELSRQEMIEQFRHSLNDIQQTMEAGKLRSDRLAKDNENLVAKLQGLTDRYEHKEATKDIQVQLYDTKLQAAQLQLQKATEDGLRDQHSLLLKLKDRDEQLQTMLASETLLRSQIDKYSAKYDELHNCLSSSNASFDRFKAEMERMNASTIKLERDSRKWKSKFEETNSSSIELAVKLKDIEEIIAQKDRQLDKMQKLCRTLQEDRTALLARVRLLGQSVECQNVLPATSEPSNVKQ